MTAVDVALFVTVIGSIVLFGGAAALALGWAFKNGQFENIDRGAQSIFGDDEPVGQATDAFPGEVPQPDALPSHSDGPPSLSGDPAGVAR